jgi:hypothetical protein
MDTKVSFDITPFMTELFKTQATILAYVKTTMTDEQKQKFDKEYVSCLKNVIIEFAEDHPNIISDADQLLSELK